MWLSPASGSVVVSVPTAVPTGSFSATVSLDRSMSVGGWLYSSVTSRLKSSVTECCDEWESVARMVKSKVPSSAGVPLMTPVALSSERPSGSIPEPMKGTVRPVFSVPLDRATHEKSAPLSLSLFPDR